MGRNFLTQGGDFFFFLACCVGGLFVLFCFFLFFSFLTSLSPPGRRLSVRDGAFPDRARRSGDDLSPSAPGGAQKSPRKEKETRGRCPGGAAGVPHPDGTLRWSRVRICPAPPPPCPQRSRDSGGGSGVSPVFPGCHLPRGRPFLSPPAPPEPTPQILRAALDPRCPLACPLAVPPCPLAVSPCPLAVPQCPLAVAPHAVTPPRPSPGHRRVPADRATLNPTSAGRAGPCGHRRPPASTPSCPSCTPKISAAPRAARPAPQIPAAPRAPPLALRGPLPAPQDSRCRPQSPRRAPRLLLVPPKSSACTPKFPLAPQNPLLMASSSLLAL